MKRRQVTIKDIAKMLNLSKSTVSRALSNAEDISKKTREKVIRKARELDYQPNRSAISLLKGKTNTLGVIIPSFTIHFYARVVSSIQNEALKYGYNIMVCQTNEDYLQEKDNVDILLRSGVDGIALSLSRNTQNVDHILRLRKKGIPVVLFNRIIPGRGFSTVSLDDFNGARKATGYLIQSGRRKIAYIGGPEVILLAKMRREGFEDAMRESSLDIKSEWIFESNFSFEDGFSFAEEMLGRKEHPDAIFCVCDQVAFGVMDCLKRNGIRIPDDIAVAGFTNETVSSLTEPPLTTVSQPMDEMGKKIAGLLIGHIRHFSIHHPPVEHVFSPELVIRSST